MRESLCRRLEALEERVSAGTGRYILVRHGWDGVTETTIWPMSGEKDLEVHIVYTEDWPPGRTEPLPPLADEEP